MDLHSAHPDPPALRQQRELVAVPDLARPQRARHHRARAADREHTVDVQARRRLGARAGRNVAGGAVERRAQLVDAVARARRHGDGLAGREQLGGLDQRHLGIGEVALGHCHDAGADPQRLEHRGVLERLRHHSVVGRDRHQKQVDAGRAGDHRPHEALVAGDVDHRQPPARGQRQARVAELDRDPSRPLLREPIGVDAGQRADQRGLPVIDVAGGP